MKKIMNPKNALALGIVLVLMTTIFLPMLSTSVISDSKDAKTVSISVIPNTNTTKSRSPGYAVYNLTVSTSSSGLSYIDFTATNVSVWTVEFLNESGVPLPTVSSGKPGISSPTPSKIYYVLTKVNVPSGIGNGTQQNHTVYVNESGGASKAVVLKTICDTFSTPAPHGVTGTAKYPGTGKAADGAFALLINTATGETSYDTVGTTGASNMSGYYSTDTSQMPSGCANTTWLQVIVSNTTNNTYGTLKIKMNNATAFQWANVTLNITGAAGDTTAPNITSTTPANGITGVALNQNITIIFSEKMNTSSVAYTPFPDPGGWPASGSWNPANDTLTLTHNDFNPGTAYTFNVTAGKDVAGNNLVSGPVPNPWTFTVTTGAVPTAPTNLTAEKSGSNILLKWDTVAGADSYKVYRSPNINGSGPWTQVNETSTPNAVRTGELADGSNYSYAVRSVSSSAGENLTYSNITFKLCYTLRKTTAKGGDQNYISIPYNFTIVGGSYTNTMKALRLEAGVSSVSKWNQTTGGWNTVGVTGIDQPLRPGEGYMLVVTSNTTYKMVGAYRETQLHLYKTTAKGGDQNYISLPYHFNITSGSFTNTMKALRLNASASSVSKWNQTTGGWNTVGVTGIDQPLVPGECYMVVVTADKDWICTIREIQ